MEIRTNPIVTFTNEEQTSAIITLETGIELVKKMREAFPQNDYSTIYIAGMSLDEIYTALATLDFLRDNEADIYIDNEQAGDILTH